MKKSFRLIHIYWMPTLFIGVGLFASVFSLFLGRQSYLQHPNLFGLVLIFCCILSTSVSRVRNVRLLFAITGICFAIYRLWWFYSTPSDSTRLAEWLTNPWTADFAVLQINYALGVIAFCMFQIFEEFQNNPRGRRMWTGVVCTLILAFVSVASLRLFFGSGEGFYFYSVAGIQPYDAFFMQLFAGFFIFRAWLLFFRHWKLFRLSLAISYVGGIILATALTAIERQIYNSVQNQLERKVADIQQAMVKDIEERLSIISIFGDFLNTIPDPTKVQIDAMMNKLNTSGMEPPAVLFFNQRFELKWVYQNNKFLWGRDAHNEIHGRGDIFVKYLKQLKSGEKFLTQNIAPGLSVSFSTELKKKNKLAGYLIFEDLAELRLRNFFSKNDFGPFNIYVRTASGKAILNSVSYLRPVVAAEGSINFLGEDILLQVTPARALAFNSVFIPQISFVSFGLLIISFLSYTVYINRKRVHDVEKEVQDRTQDMKILKEEADRAKMIAEHASYSKSQFLANMSHEIRTPLNVLLGASELLAETKLNTEQKTFVDMFQTSGKHLLGLLNDIIDLSRIESRQLETEKIPFDLVKTLEFVQKLFSMKSQEQGLEFFINSDQVSSSTRMGDPLRIRQVLVNLIGNSFKFTKKGSVSLSVSEMPGDVVQFIVEDTGSGIPDEKQREIFETFQQGDVSFSRKHGGAGLGLAITRNLCELMGGSIQLKSRLSYGSQFIVQIPLPRTQEVPVRFESPEVEKSTTELTAATQAPSPKTITTGDFEESGLSVSNPSSARPFDTRLKRLLLVDDSDDNRFLVRLFLENSHFEISEAKNGQEAVDLAFKKTFDIILMDMQMPIMDGYEAVKVIRQYENDHKELSKVPILALTAHGTNIEKNKCLEIGCTDYLSKPVSRKALIGRISDLISTSNT